MSADALPPTAGSIAFGHFRVPCHPDGQPVELGRGAMGVTYRAFDTGLHREVALKVIHTDRVTDGDYRRRFQREARAAAQVRHPNVATVLHLGEQDGEVFYAMEFIAGRPLSDLLRDARGPLPVRVAVALAAQVAAALSAAHRKTVVHRDLKPGNLMLLEGAAVDHEDERTTVAGGRQLKVIDFGLARKFGAGRSEDSMVTRTAAGFMGTPVYASPEQCAEAAELDDRSDLYAVGVILWEMLTGRLPFVGSVGEVLGQHLFHPPPWEQLTEANVPAPLVDLIAGLLAKKPAERRPQTAGELRDGLDAYLRASGPPPPTATAPASSASPRLPPAPTAGFSLLDLLRARGALRPGEILRLLAGLPAALDAGDFPPAAATLRRIIVVPASGEHPDAADWAALRARPVEGWPAFALQPRSEADSSRPPTAAATKGEHTRLTPATAHHPPGSAAAITPPAAVLLARLVRELLGAPPQPPGEAPRPLPALNAAANTALNNAAGFPDAAAFWRVFRRVVRADEVTPLGPLPPPLLSPAGDGPAVPGLTPSPSPLPPKPSLATMLGGPKIPVRTSRQILIGAVAAGILVGTLWPLLRSSPAPAAGGKTVPAVAVPSASPLPSPAVVPPTPVAVAVATPAANPTPVPTPEPTPTPVPAAVAVVADPPAPTLSTPEPTAVMVMIPPPSDLAVPPEAPPALTPTPAPPIAEAVAPTDAAVPPVTDRSFTNAAGRRMVWIPPGTFLMGTPADDPANPASDQPARRSAARRRSRTAAATVNDETARRVTLSRGFWLDQFEVTQGFYRDVTGANPSGFPNAGPDAPVEQVSWHHAVAFCDRLTARESAAGRLPPNARYGLPTEAQWEYACRAGTTGPVYGLASAADWVIRADNDAPALDPIAWYGGNSGVDYPGAWDSSSWRGKQFRHRRAGTHPVGQKQPNAWGLFDMLGNVWEWCADSYAPVPATAGADATDPAGPATGGRERVLRGGAWSYPPRFHRAAARAHAVPETRQKHFGFRVALLPVGSPAEPPAVPAVVAPSLPAADPTP